MSTWVAINKGYASKFSKIKREYSEIEAIYSLSLDANCLKVRSLRSYSRMWGWSVGKVKRFLIQADLDGTATEQRRNSDGTDLSLILLNKSDGTEQRRNRDRTAAEHKYKEQEVILKDTVQNGEEKPKPKKETVKYSDLFEKFWKAYPNKSGKKNAFASWKRNDFSGGLFLEIMKSLDMQKKGKNWTKENGKYIPMGSTWVNGRRWEDEFEEEKSEWR